MKFETMLVPIYFLGKLTLYNANFDTIFFI